MAYDDVVAIVQPHDMAIPFAGAIKANTLMAFLSSVGPDVKFEASEGSVKVSAGRPNIVQPLIDITYYRQVFPTIPSEGAQVLSLAPIEMPGVAPNEGPVLADNPLVAAIRECIPTLGFDTNHTWALGIALDFTEAGVTVYSSDADATTRVELPGWYTECAGLFLNLPPRFCQLFDEFCRSEVPLELKITKDWVEVTFQSGRRLFSRTVPDPDVTKLRQIYARMDEDIQSYGSNTIPGEFRNALQRMLIVLSALPEMDRLASMQIQENGKINFLASSSLGQIDDELDFEEGVGYPLQLKIKPEAIIKCLPGTAYVSSCPRYLVLRGETVTRLVLTCT